MELEHPPKIEYDKKRSFKKIINQGVKNLKAYGYPAVTAENIFTDEIYSIIFKDILKENLGQDEKIDILLNELISQIK